MPRVKQNSQAHSWDLHVLPSICPEALQGAKDASDLPAKASLSHFSKQLQQALVSNLSSMHASLIGLIPKVIANCQAWMPGLYPISTASGECKSFSAHVLLCSCSNICNLDIVLYLQHLQGLMVHDTKSDIIKIGKVLLDVHDGPKPIIQCAAVAL